MFDGSRKGFSGLSEEMKIKKNSLIILMGILFSISLPSFRNVKQRRDGDWTAQYHVGGNKIKKN